MESISEKPGKETGKVLSGVNSNSDVNTEEFAQKISKIDDAERENMNEELSNGTMNGEGKISEDVNGTEIDISNEEKNGFKETDEKLSDSNKVETLSVEDVSMKEAIEINGSELGVDDGSCKTHECSEKDSPEVVVNRSQSINGALEVNGAKEVTEDVTKAQHDIENDDLVNIDDVAIDVNGEINDVNVKGHLGQTENTTEIKDSDPSALNGHRNEANKPLHEDETFDNVKLQPDVEPNHSQVNSSADFDKEIAERVVHEDGQKENALDFSDTALLLTKGSAQEPTAIGNGSHFHEELHKQNSSDIEIIDEIGGKSNASNMDGSHEEKVAKDVVKKIKSKKIAADGGKGDFDAIISDSVEPDESNVTCKLLIDGEVNESTTTKTKETKGGKVRQNMCACYPRRRKDGQAQDCSVM